MFADMKVSGILKSPVIGYYIKGQDYRPMTDITFLQFPLSLIMALVSLAGLVLLWAFLPQGKFRRFLSGRWLCAASIVAFLVLTAIEGTWGTAMHRNPAMWTVSAVMMVSLGFAILDSIKAGRGLAGILSHSGLFILFFGAFWGAPDVTDVRMAVYADHEENSAWSRDGRIVRLPFKVSLKEFSTEYYEDGESPRQYSSVLLVDGREYRTSVNHPCRCRGLRIYQSDFDHECGEYSVLKLVRDPWIVLVYLGILLLAAGAVMGLVNCWNSRYMLLVMAVLAVVFTFISVARINFGTLMPALRSLWFIPHLALYMLAYSSLALSLIAGAVSLFADNGRKKVSGYGGSGKIKYGPLSLQLLNTASALLLLGMMCGAVWAKAAWGDWWTWDAKECWAAVTWLFTILGTHLPLRNPSLQTCPPMISGRRMAVLACILLAFIAMQMAWYGVELLPASQASLHTYR